MLYMPVGAPCNICNDSEKDPRPNLWSHGYNRMVRDRKCTQMAFRIQLGFAWHPVTGELWFTENGRDMLGDDIPSDELNRAQTKDQHFGYPYCHAGEIMDPEFGAGHSCSDYVAPMQKLAPHSCPRNEILYWKHVPGRLYKPDIHRGAWIMEPHRTHGISNYIEVKLDESGTVSSYEVFAEGWLKDGEAWGRPRGPAATRETDPCCIRWSRQRGVQNHLREIKVEAQRRICILCCRLRTKEVRLFKADLYIRIMKIAAIFSPREVSVSQVCWKVFHSLHYSVSLCP